MSLPKTINNLWALRLAETSSIRFHLLQTELKVCFQHLSFYSSSILPNISKTAESQALTATFIKNTDELSRKIKSNFHRFGPFCSELSQGTAFLSFFNLFFAGGMSYPYLFINSLNYESLPHLLQQVKTYTNFWKITFW